MHIVYQITEEEIRSELNHAIQLLIDDEIIKFRSDYARREFLEDCVSVVLDKFDIKEKKQMKILYKITDDMIRSELEYTAKELESEEIIRFHSEQTKTEFIDECFQSIIDKFELYEYSPVPFIPNYEDEILDSAKYYPELIVLL